MDRRLIGLGIVLMLALGALPVTLARAGGCPVPLPHGSDPVTLDPANFVSRIDNPYSPMVPGTRWVYRETDPPGPVRKSR